MTRSTHAATPIPFTPVPVRARHDGWTPERQVAFIEALATTASVAAAAKAVGMGTSSAYELRARADAVAFRQAWQVALDYAVHQLGEAALDRAINGTTNPIFFRGEQIGEHRRYDERLTLFILRLRDPERYGRWLDDRVPLPDADVPATLLDTALDRLRKVAALVRTRIAPWRLVPTMTTREKGDLLADTLLDMKAGILNEDGSEPDERGGT